MREHRFRHLPVTSGDAIDTSVRLLVRDVSADGLPLSEQFVGRRLSEAVLCRIGHAY